MGHRAATLIAGAVLAAAGTVMAAAGDRVTVVYVNGIATSAAQAAADRAALAAAVEGAALRAAYPETIDVEHAYNPTGGTAADVAELVALKANEELYLPRLWTAFREGNDAPGVLDPAAIDEIVAVDLARDPPAIRAVVDGLVALWAARLADPSRRLVLVGHSQGNFIVDGALLGLLRQRGPGVLAQVRVVNVGSSTRWSPFGLDVTLAEDFGVSTFLPAQGRKAPRDTPFCRTAGARTGCPFIAPTATVDATEACTSAAAQPAAGATCHNFRATYLSALPTLPAPTQRYTVSVPEREGTTVAERLVDAIYTAIDGMQAAVPAGFDDDLFGAYYGRGASAPAPGRLRLAATAATPRASAVGKATFDRGAVARWQGCLPADGTGDAWVVLDLQSRDGILAPSVAEAGPPLWGVGVLARAAAPQTLEFVFGRDALPTLETGTERRAANPAKTGNAFCGRFELAIDAEGHGVARFRNQLGGTVGFRSSVPVTGGMKRLHLSTGTAAPLDADGLDVQPVLPTTPFQSR